MPNVSITVYLNDEDYVKYVSKKEELNLKTREYFKEQLRKISKDI